jgi:hypothetical protein
MARSAEHLHLVAQRRGGRKLHLDYRERRGVGAGPDLNLHLGQWGDAT